MLERSSFVVQWVKDLALSLQQLWSLLWHKFDPWPKNFHMPQVQAKTKQNKTRKRKKRCLIDFNFVTFTEACFVAQHVIYPGECSMCIWKECIFCSFEMKSLYIFIKSTWSNVSFKATVSCLIFLSGWNVHWYKWVLKSPTIIVIMSIYPFMSVNICSMYLGAPMLGTCIFTIVISSSWIDPLTII